MEKSHEKNWAELPGDLIGNIRSRLAGSDYVAFGKVCTSFYSVSLNPVKAKYSSTQLLTVKRGSGSFKMFDPILNTFLSDDINVPQLTDYEILCSRGNWVLMGQQLEETSMFFFNAKTLQTISLPKCQIGHYSPIWTFSGSPELPNLADLPWSLVIGIDKHGSPPAVFLIEVGGQVWSHYDFVDGKRTERKDLTNCVNPVIVGNHIYVLTDELDVGRLILGYFATMEPIWTFLGFSEKQIGIKDAYLIAENNESIIAVVVRVAGDIVGETSSGGVSSENTSAKEAIEVWRYLLCGGVWRLYRVRSLKQNNLFVSSASSLLKPVITSGFSNKIFFPTLHGGNRALFFCLDSQTYYSFDYLLNKTHSSKVLIKSEEEDRGVWIDVENW